MIDHTIVDDILRRMKKDMDEHVDNYQKLAKDLTIHEKDVIENLQAVSPRISSSFLLTTPLRLSN